MEPRSSNGRRVGRGSGRDSVKGGHSPAALGAASDANEGASKRASEWGGLGGLWIGACEMGTWGTEWR